MPTKQSIQFEEISTSATDFLHELNDPSLLRAADISPKVAVELRKQHLLKLRENIDVLTAKRTEFNRKIEEYIQNLKALIRNVEKSIATAVEKLSKLEAETHPQATLVRCLCCDTQRIFRDLQILFARESDESLSLPTELYVLQGEIFKKGRFRCGTCGDENLLIRPV